MSTTKINADLKQIKIELDKQFNALIQTKNEPQDGIGNGIYTRYKNPVLTAAHTPLEWRFDFNPNTNPLLLERIAINATFNAGAINGMTNTSLLPCGRCRQKIFNLES